MFDLNAALALLKSSVNDGDLLNVNRPLVTISSTAENDLALPCTCAIESSSPPVCCVGVDHQTVEFLLL